MTLWYSVYLAVLVKHTKYCFLTDCSVIGFTNGSVIVHFHATVEEVEEVTVAVEPDVSIEENF